MKMKFLKYSPFLLASFVWVGLATFAFADTIKLLSGRIIEGVIVERDDQFVKIKQGDKLLTIPVKVIDDGTKKKRYLKRPMSNKTNDSTAMSIRERLRAIREAEYKEQMTIKNETLEGENKEIIETKNPPMTKKEIEKNEDPDYDRIGGICTDMEKYILNCPHIICKQKHPSERFVVRHSFKGFYALDGSNDKCNYEQSIPGDAGDAIDCYFDPFNRRQFLKSLMNGGSPVFSENEFLQKALQEGTCIKVNRPQISNK